jgi:lysosomal acid phosphatase
MMKQLLALGLTLGLAARALAGDPDEPVFAVVVNRHGDRAPFNALPQLGYTWGVPPAELTAIGMSQTYALGTRLRERYVYRARLLAPRYQVGSIAAYASNANRAISSAQCILTGLYPPGTGPDLGSGHAALPARLQVIPIRTLPESSSLILTPFPVYRAIVEKYVYSTPAWLARDAAIRPRLAAWSSAVGRPLTSLKDVLLIGDVLNCAASHGFRAPPALSPADVREILELTSRGIAAQFQVGAVSWLMANQLLAAIRAQFEEFRTHKAPHRLALYSGHDITLLPLLALLGSPRDESVGYASHVALELHRARHGGLRVRVTCDGEIVRLPGAKGKTSIPYEDFLALVDTALARHRGLAPPIVK